MMERKTLEFDIPQFMTDIREKLGKKTSLRDLADKLNVSASTLSRIDNGAMPDINTFIAICQALELDPAPYFVWYHWKGERVDHE